LSSDHPENFARIPGVFGGVLVAVLGVGSRLTAYPRMLVGIPEDAENSWVSNQWCFYP
jgi:hypothetical protein